MSDLVLIIFSTALANNIVVLGVIGADPALAFLRKMDVAIELCFTMLVLLPLVILAAYFVDTWLLVPLHIEYFQLIVFISVIFLVTGCIKQWGYLISKKLHERIKLFLPFAGINTTVLGAVLLNEQLANGLLNSLAYGLGSASGFCIILLILTACTERLEVSDVPLPFRGMPILLLTLALISMAFMGFNGMAGN